ncbi:hypothetical protein GDO78_004937 [Eleutherodactylus coqui]|uniref:Uncharacterized protein n=1 Tax=Eleutherodactylus coqui TaxID=57060 RepID=A0A8J6FJ09_ELECQ|nr:hypothetical protein GDO78_004937 [Eleutherodactylus coqui]
MVVDDTCADVTRYDVARWGRGQTELRVVNSKRRLIWHNSDDVARFDATRWGWSLNARRASIPLYELIIDMMVYRLTCGPS